MTTGKAYLVGAGPGDPDLLTLKAARVIGQADVLLVDDLVAPAVLEHARPDARIIGVGKRGGCVSTPQAYINRLMINEVQSGATVVRLKGGDPFVFGRGGEELLALQAAGLAVEVVPGLTSGISAATAAGLPVTHRRISRGVTLITGHTQDGSEPDWAALAHTNTTLVIYMGMTRIGHIVAALLAGGMPASTPAAVIQSGSLPNQRQLRSTLVELPAASARSGMKSPAIILLGDVLGLFEGEAQSLVPQVSPQAAAI